MSQELEKLFKNREYAIWKMESFKGTNKYIDALNILNNYNKKIKELQNRRQVLTQLTLF